MKKEYDVASYVWPSYTGDCQQTRIFWEQGIGEWQTVHTANPKYEGHKLTIKPLWVYVNEANPEIMEMEINAATNFKDVILKNNPSENFEKALVEAKKFADGNDIPLIPINSWNEWTQGSYSEPDDLYGYLETVKREFKD